jgi:hypothetical protein
MEDLYYNIRQIMHPEKNGIVVCIKEGKLECLTGGKSQLEEYGCVLVNGRFVVGDDYYDLPISQRKANELKAAYLNHIGLQTMVDEQGPVNKMALIPGDPRLRNLF